MPFELSKRTREREREREEENEGAERERERETEGGRDIERGLEMARTSTSRDIGR